jgi:hypothetical protein
MPEPCLPKTIQRTLGGFDAQVMEPYAISLGGLSLWNMVYFKGRRPHHNTVT